VEKELVLIVFGSRTLLLSYYLRGMINWTMGMSTLPMCMLEVYYCRQLSCQ
jgi:hypothetical protein